MTGLSPHYYEQYREALRSHWWFRGRKQVLDSLVSPIVPRQAVRCVADLGSGPGGPARTLFPHAWLVAFDLSMQPLDAYMGADGRVVADAANVPCRSGNFEVVCAFDILEHVDDDRGALQEWRRIVMPSGWLVLTVPAYQALWSAHDDANAHRRRYHAHRLQQLLREAGFRVVRLTYFNTLLLPGVAIVRWTERLFRGMNRNGHEASTGELDFQKRFPWWLERCCEGVLALEARWLRHASLPVGVSIGVVARAAEGRDA